jgi:hypothetical protein
VRHPFAVAVDVAHHRQRPARHGFEQRDRGRIGARRRQVDLGTAEPSGHRHRIEAPHELEAPRRQARGREPLEFGPQPAVAGDRQVEVGPLGHHPPHPVEQGRQIVDRLVHARAQEQARLARLPRPEARQVHSPGDRAHTPGEGSERARGGGEVLAVGEHVVGAREHVARAQALERIAPAGDQQIRAPRRHHPWAVARQRREQAVIGHVVRIHQIGPVRLERPPHHPCRERVAQETGQRRRRHPLGPERRGPLLERPHAHLVSAGAEVLGPAPGVEHGGVREHRDSHARSPR